MTKYDKEWLRAMLDKRGRGARADLARYLGVPPDVISKIISGDRRIQSNELMPIINFFSPKSALLPQSDESTQALLVEKLKDGRFVEIRDLNYSDETDIDASIRLSIEFCRTISATDPTMLRTVRMLDDSMANSLFTGDLVIVDIANNKVESGGIYAVRSPRGLAVRRLKLSDHEPRVHLVPENSQQCDDDFVSPSSLEIVGRAIWKLTEIK